MRYVLDTNIIADLMRRPQGRGADASGRLARRRVAPAPSSLRNCANGAAKKGSPRLSARIEAVLSTLEVLPFEAPADAAYARLRSRLEQAGQPIGGNDLLIAAQVVALGHTIAIDNEREFARIDELRSENWLR
jgi:tRNA(fMet)-specific endonuclease VapC